MSSPDTEYNSEMALSAMSNEALRSEPHVILELAKARLRVVNNELQRLNNLDSPTLRLPLTAIEVAEIRSQWDPAALVVIAGVALGMVARFVAENNNFAIILYVVGIVAVAFGILGIQRREICIRARGALIKIPCLDKPDEGDGFVCSIRELLNDSSLHRQPENCDK